jgi:hypothetical protein
LVGVGEEVAAWGCLGGHGKACGGWIIIMDDPTYLGKIPVGSQKKLGSQLYS